MLTSCFFKIKINTQQLQEKQYSHQKGPNCLKVGSMSSTEKLLFDFVRFFIGINALLVFFRPKQNLSISKQIKVINLL